MKKSIYIFTLNDGRDIEVTLHTWGARIVEVEYFDLTNNEQAILTKEQEDELIDFQRSKIV